MSADPTFWNKLAERYAASPVELPEAFERKIAITKERIPPGGVVLDVGCGTGSLALRLASSAGEVHGLDFSTEMLRIARGKAEGVEGVQFHQGAFDESVPFEEQSIDVLCAYSLLHLVEDRGAVLALAYRLLKPGGSFIASTTCLGNTWVPYAPLLVAMRWVGKAPMVKVLASGTLAAEVAAAGFIELEEPEVGAKATTMFLVARKPLRG